MLLFDKFWSEMTQSLRSFHAESLVAMVIQRQNYRCVFTNLLFYSFYGRLKREPGGWVILKKTFRLVAVKEDKDADVLMYNVKYEHEGGLIYTQTWTFWGKIKPKLCRNDRKMQIQWVKVQLLVYISNVFPKMGRL